jgi:hypothetical protein
VRKTQLGCFETDFKNGHLSSQVVLEPGGVLDLNPDLEVDVVLELEPIS